MNNIHAYTRIAAGAALSGAIALAGLGFGSATAAAIELRKPQPPLPSAPYDQQQVETPGGPAGFDPQPDPPAPRIIIVGP
ncbi:MULTISPECIES: hypothetical protein [Mycolicibacterium]|jgi:hypothetical protein|uniref:Alanine and proline-rich secreted protein Apa n=1 Tax=Mycolicibacterium austroafricanum TaxID=39687 RepID=A0ABT8HCM9_MYCAO|nr:MULTISPECIES: hypothetical protein [Mycolicibacterium]MDN4518520.1 hypothetical protein [Mycolicibacterium austroafricanum]MDW5613820.1 hypothetical protein [Mycolicibacterium sp. D5.8-2]QRZ08549.1 hypothetical protein JN090_08555 [Mycolicibacterium austroafricanum]QZT70199.1 hypothetical protein JN086_09495 [Mycolicibacterium austroafricanum]